jgi:hypothetical protein
MAAAGKASNAAVNGKGYDEHWQQPTGTPMPKLKVWNSLTRSKVRLGSRKGRAMDACAMLKTPLRISLRPQVDFVPAKGKNITW